MDLTQKLCLLALVVAAESPAAGTDTVRVSAAGRSGETKLTGEVIEYTGLHVRVRLPGGREEQLDSRRVLEVITNWNQQCLEGDEQFALANFAQAIERYREGLQAEQRTWARRRILSQLVWCFRHTGQTLSAVDSFLLLYGSDPTTQYFSSIPLTWTTPQPDANLQSKLRQRLNENLPVTQLIAASWLLSTSDRPSALQKLRGLDDPDPRIGFLAQAQLWRSQIGRLTADEIRHWEERTALMPAEIRAGPYFTVGRGWSQVGNPEFAALAFLRIPILYSHERELAANSLLAAGLELEALQQQDAAHRLYQEVLTAFPGSPNEGEARQRLARNQPVR
jgi:tetratricopeptide (TPR) repeat protein